MALIERLMGLDSDGVSTAPDESEDPTRAKIAVHDFFAAQSEIIAGRLTLAQVKNYLQMDTESQAEYDALAATAPIGTTALAMANKALFIEKIHGVFILAESRYPGYSTPAEVRSKLEI